MMKMLLRTALSALMMGAAMPLSAFAADQPSNTDLMQRIDLLSKQIELLKKQVKASEAKAGQAAKTQQEVERLKTRMNAPSSKVTAGTQQQIDQLESRVQAVDAKAAKAASAAQAQADRVSEVKDDMESLANRSLSRWLTISGDYRFRIDNLRGKTEPFTDVFATFNNAQQKLQADFFANPTTAPGSSSYFGGMGMSTAGALSAFAGFSQAMNGVRSYSDAVAFQSNPMNAALLQGLNTFAVQLPTYHPSIDTLYTNRLRLEMHAKATEDVGVTVRLEAYKVFGGQTDNAITNAGGAPFFADRVGVFDGTLGHVPSTSLLNVDRAYADWSNIFNQPIWFSVGRRPSTEGAPSNLRFNGPRPGQGGTPALLVDYAFDGMTVGYAPDIEMLPGAFIKLCYGRGFQEAFQQTPSNSIGNTDMVGVSVVPIDTEPLRVWLQWNRGMNIFDAPEMSNTYFGNVAPKANLGDIDWFGAGAMSTIKNVGPGNVNVFFDAAASITHPNNNVSAQFGFQGLLTGGFFRPEAPTDKQGYAFYMGLRYDLPTGTKLGFEYNHGSKNWITFAPAADDIWTSKLGTRGNVLEAYVIQELPLKAVSSFFSKTFVRVGAQYYDFEYTGSNNWVGAPVKMSAARGQLMALTPLQHSYDIYSTIEVHF